MVENIVAIFQAVSVTGLLTMTMAMLLLNGGLDLSSGDLLAMVCVIMSVLLRGGTGTTTPTYEYSFEVDINEVNNFQGMELWLVILIGIGIAVFVIPYLELAEEHNLCVVSHTGGCEKASPVHVYEAAKMFKNVNFVMVHMGLGTDNKDALDLLGKCDNLYGDTTWVPMSTTIEAIKRYGSKKMMFGSDAPIDGTDTYLHNRNNNRSIYQDYFYVLPDLISENDYDDLMYKNAERVFKLRIEE